MADGSLPARSPPPELSALLAARDPAARERAWSDFVNAYSRLMLHAARGLGSDYDAVMDRYTFVLEQLRQDDFRRLRSYVADGRGKFTTWLTVVARRLYLDHQRQRYGRTRSDTEEAGAKKGTRRRLVDLVAEELDVQQIEGSQSENPDASLRTSELREALAACLSGLAARDRLLLALRFEDDLPARQIAEVMGFPTLFHVYRRLNAVLASLRGELQRRGIHDAAP